MQVSLLGSQLVWCAMCVPFVPFTQMTWQLVYLVRNLCIIRPCREVACPQRACCAITTCMLHDVSDLP